MIDEVVDYDDADAEGRCGLRMARFRGTSEISPYLDAMRGESGS